MDASNEAEQQTEQEGISGQELLKYLIWAKVVGIFLFLLSIVVLFLI